MSRNISMMNGISFIGGIVCASCAFLSRVLCGSPLDMIHKLEGLEILPPIWIFNLLCVAWYFLIGAAAGYIIQGIRIGCVSGREEILAYRGGLFFLVVFFLGLIWYPLLFIGQSIFFSFVISLLVTISAVICALFWFSARLAAPSLLICAYSIWCFYMLVINLSALLGI